MFSYGSNKPVEKEDSVTRKPYLTLDEKTAKNSTPKNSTSSVYNNSIYKGTKTTTNQEAKTISYSTPSTYSAQHSNINLSSSSRYGSGQVSSTQDSAKRGNSSTSKVSKPSTPSNRTTRDSQELSLTPSTTSSNEKKTFLYYMAFLEKYHRNYFENDYFCQIYREHFLQSYQAMMFCKYLKPVDPKVLSQKRVFLNKRETHKGNIFFYRINFFR
jgi:hypothetical protein